MDEMVKLKTNETQHRWQTAIKDKAFNLIRHLPILETRPENFLRVLETGKVSTNVYLRRIHNFALDMPWLPWPVIVKRQWPKVRYKDKRAITWEEHQAVVARELNPERKAFYKLAWHIGASQTDLARLEAENIDWDHNVISFERKKTGSIAIIRFDDEVAEILRDLSIAFHSSFPGHEFSMFIPEPRLRSVDVRRQSASTTTVCRVRALSTFVISSHACLCPVHEQLRCGLTDRSRVKAAGGSGQPGCKLLLNVAWHPATGLGQSSYMFR